MKMVIDERVKHRLIGLAVILSIAAIFAPAIMKKSHQRIDENLNVTVKLPPKPIQPEIEVIEKKEMFESAKVAHVELPKSSERPPLATIARAESISQARVEPLKVNNSLALLEEEKNKTRASLPTENQALVGEESNKISTSKNSKIAENSVQLKPILLAKEKQKSLVKPGKKIEAKSSINNKVKEGYAVQVATFAQLKNANALISRLKIKGYKADYIRVKTKNGYIYKILVGQMAKKEQAQRLQKQLANAVQLNGFIVSSAKG